MLSSSRAVFTTSFLELTCGKVYDVISMEKGWCRIVDGSGEDYLYPPNDFVVVEGNNDTVPISG